LDELCRQDAAEPNIVGVRSIIRQITSDSLLDILAAKRKEATIVEQIL
jgi:hypothetical protein